MPKWIYPLLVGIVLLSGLFLRSYRLSELPPAPYWEEVALGYDAYSILKTGKDHHGQSWPVVAFESFGDWKPSGYFYAIVPFIQLLGLHTLAVRLPAMLAGVAIVGGVGVLSKLVTDVQRSKSQTWLPLIAMGITAISPWAILFSRGGWEVNLATALIVWGVCAGLASHTYHHPPWRRVALLILSAVLLVLSMYTYHAARLIAPVLGLGIGLLYLWQLRSETIIGWAIPLILTGLVALALTSPLLLALGSQETQQRFAETSILSDSSLLEDSRRLKEEAGNTILAKLFYHRYFFYAREILISYVAHFRLDFLFLTGDTNPRHSVRYFGLFYHIEVIFLVWGMYSLFRSWKSSHALLLLWFIVGIMPAALTNASPHALRILPTLPVWLLLVSWGVHAFGQKVQRLSSQPMRYILIGLLATIYFIEFTLFWRYYTAHYPVAYANAWQYGYEEVVTEINAHVSEYPRIYVTQDYGRPAMYYWFYSQTEPTLVQTYVREHNLRGEIASFNTILFIPTVKEVTSAPALVVSTEEGERYLRDRYTIREVKRVHNPLGELLWVIYDIR